MAVVRALKVSTGGGFAQIPDADQIQAGSFGGATTAALLNAGGDSLTMTGGSAQLSSGVGLASAGGSATITGFDSATFTTKVVTPEIESTGGSLVFDANNASDSTITFQNAGAGALTGSFAGDLTITGDLTVQGTQFISDTTNVQVEDNHLYLNKGYETVSAETGGLVVNYLPTSTNDTVATGGFTAGVDGVSDPTIATTGAATFAATDLVQVEGAADPANDGLYEVQGHAANVLTLKSTAFGVTNQVEDFTNNQLVTDTTVAGTIRKVNVSIIRAGTDGAWETGSGSATPITFSDLAAGATTLQSSYESGNTITLADGDGDLTITLDDAGASADFALLDSGGDYLRTDATGNTLDLGSSANAVDIVGTSLVMTGNPTVDGGTGQWDFGGNVDANAGLDVSGGALTAASGITNSAGEVLLSGGNLQLNDNITLSVGTGDDLSIVHNGTDTVITSATGDLIIDNTNATGSTIIRLGTDTSATDFQVQGDDASPRFTVTGATASVTVADGVAFNANGAVNLGDNDGDLVTIGGGSSDIVSFGGQLNVETVTIESNGGTETWILTADAQTGAGVKGVNISIIAGAGSGTDGEGGDVTLCGGAGGATNGDGGDLFLKAGALAGAGADGDVVIAGADTANVLIGNATDNPPITQVGTGLVTFVGLVVANDVDARTATTLLLGKETATKVEIADTSVTTEMQGPVTILGGFDTLGAAAMNVAAANATALNLGASDITTAVLGAFTTLSGIDTNGAAALAVGGANATALNLGASDITTTVLGAANFDLAVTFDATVGITGILTLASTLIGTDDGTVITLGHVPTGASTGSAPGFINVTTTQMNQLVPVDGMVVYNTTLSQFMGYDDGAWKAFGGGGLTTGTENDIWTINEGAVAGGDEDACLELIGTTASLVRHANICLDTSADTWFFYEQASGDTDNTTSLDQIFVFGHTANTPGTDDNDVT
ncbi:MAG TPA: hypothetical protein VMX12_12440, partial [Acidimicrobiia bacterium]|nr:hypothetical protein [Acidimicrobiia bacterium]